MKNGILVETVPLDDQECYLIGRNPDADIISEHQSVSRNHAIIQFRENSGAFLFDLASTHKTFLNKKEVVPKKYYPLQHGLQIKFGESSRVYIVIGPESVQVEAAAKPPLAVSAPDPVKEPAEGDEAYASNPKKHLYDYLTSIDALPIKLTITQVSATEFLASVQVPQITTQEFKATRKKDAEKMACYLALQELDRLGLLNAESDAKTESRRVKKLLTELDCGDEDDGFFDRTGAPGRRDEAKVETFESLSLAASEVQSKMNLMQESVIGIQTSLDQNEGEEVDDLDAYMVELNAQTRRKELKVLRSQMKELEKQRDKIHALLEIVRPKESDLFVRGLTKVVVGEGASAKPPTATTLMNETATLKSKDPIFKSGQKREAPNSYLAPPPSKRVFGAVPQRQSIEANENQSKSEDERMDSAKVPFGARVVYDDEELIDATSRIAVDKAKLESLNRAYGY